MILKSIAKGEVVTSPSGLEYQLINSNEQPLLVLTNSVLALARKGDLRCFAKLTIKLENCDWIEKDVKLKTIESWNI